MGRCQGGFCSYRIMKIIERETGQPIEAVTKRGGMSRMISDRVGALSVSHSTEPKPKTARERKR
jgi:glycerol-3-phosphate dehydrogenase